MAIILKKFNLIQESVQTYVYDRAFLSDCEVVKFAYAKTNDHLPDLERPRWFNEKIRWLFLNHPNPLMSFVADKIAVREYLRFRDAQIQPPRMIAMGTDPAEILDIDLPAEFALKSAYGSGQNHIEKAGMNTPRGALACMINSWSQHDQWRTTGELHYHDVPKRWLVEEFVPSARGQTEYKIFCMMGRPAFILVISDRSGPKCYKRMIYDTDWNPVDFHWKVTPPIEEKPVPRPAAFETMLSDARLLSADFLQVRVDFLQCDDRIVFSELTFASAAGRIPFTPESANEEIGNLIDLERADEYLARGRCVMAEMQAARENPAVGKGLFWGSAARASVL